MVTIYILFSNIFCFYPVTDRVFGPDTITEEVYEVAARPVVKAAMDGVNGMLKWHSTQWLFIS